VFWKVPAIPIVLLVVCEVRASDRASRRPVTGSFRDAVPKNIDAPDRNHASLAQGNVSWVLHIEERIESVSPM